MTLLHLIGVTLVIIGAYLRLLSQRIADAEKRIEELEKGKSNA
jgi:hypothetical protein